MFMLPLDLGLAVIRFVASQPWTVNHELMDALRPHIALYFTDIDNRGM